VQISNTPLMGVRHQLGGIATQEGLTTGEIRLEDA
jgi:hypothetical protein